MMASIPVPDPDFGGGRFGGRSIRRILVADDERHIVRLIQVNLERQGYEVITASDGRDALKKAEKEIPDLIVLDVTMPQMDGFEVLQNLKKNRSTKDIPVIMLTTNIPRTITPMCSVPDWLDTDPYLSDSGTPLHFVALSSRSPLAPPLLQVAPF